MYAIRSYYVATFHPGLGEMNRLDLLPDAERREDHRTRYNTQTNRLTPEMFRAVFRQIQGEN